MAKLRKTLPPGMSYVYYDKLTGDIFSITNELSSKYEYGILAPYEDVKLLLEGTRHFKDYVVSYKKESNGSKKLCVQDRMSAKLTVGDSDYTFKNKTFEWITESNDDAECIITWNKPKKMWNFSVCKELKQENNTVASKLIFFITLEGDLDFLIRTIVLDFDELIEKDISVDFDSKFELDVDKISISSKLVFKSYKLNKIYE